jgi:hypothetical protein
MLREKTRETKILPGVRDLLAAGWLGEQTFAQLGLHRAVSVLQDPGERTKVIAQAWKIERPVSATLGIALGAVSLLGIVRAGRRERSGLDRAASACALGAVVTGFACAVAGKVVGHAVADHETPIATGFTPNEDTPARARAAQRTLRILAPIGMVLGVASIGLSVAGRSCE